MLLEKVECRPRSELQRERRPVWLHHLCKTTYSIAKYTYSMPKLHHTQHVQRRCQCENFITRNTFKDDANVKTSSHATRSKTMPLPKLHHTQHDHTLLEISKTMPLPKTSSHAFTIKRFVYIFIVYCVW